MAQLEAVIRVEGIPQLLAQVRNEVARLLREAATKETDSRVSQRLMEIAAEVAQNTAQAEASELMKAAPEHTSLPHRKAAPASTPSPTAIVPTKPTGAS